MKLAVVGSRSITDKEWVFEQINSYLFNRYTTMAREGGKLHTTFISGGAEGVDSLVKEYAKKQGDDFIMFQPYFLLDKLATFSNRHFFTRNRQIVFNADEVLVLWDGVSKGSDYTRKYAERMGKVVTVIKYEGGSDGYQNK